MTHGRYRRAAAALTTLLAAYVIAAYVVMPEGWRIDEWLWRGTRNAMVTRTPADIPGDPINVGLVGSRAEVIKAFAAARWDTADAVTLASSVEIGLGVLFDRPFPDAPVSTLLFDGRPQTFAFEKPIGNSPARRNHVRLWLMAEQVEGRAYWLASASLDVSTGLSHDTGQITHHIGPDIDAERNLLVGDLRNAGAVERTYDIPGAGATQSGRNGGGDPYVTDGRATIVVLKPDVGR